MTIPSKLCRIASVLAVLSAVPLLRLSAQDKWYDRVTFDGDFRLRHESFWQSGDEFDERGRLRIRLRAGFTMALSKSFSTGFRLASIEPGSVTSHNVSLTGTSTTKTIAIDRAFLTWTPSSRVTVTGGKFANPLLRAPGLMRSELVFDDEVTGEGLHQQVNLVSSRTGLVRRFALMAEQWSQQEFSDRTDAWMLGGQAALELAPAARTTLFLSAGYLGWLHGRFLATARNSNAALVVSNSVELRDGTILEGGKPLSPTTANPFAAFVSEFNLVTGSAGLAIDRLLGRHPVQLYADLVHNAGAEEERTGLWSGVTVGALRSRGDWSASVVYTHVERESVLSMYSYSDLGVGGTNVKGPIVTAQFRPARELTLSYRHHFMRPVTPAEGVLDRTLHRIMLDAAVSF